MTITFENDNDVICYALEKIISYARDNQYIFLAQSIWWISSVIGLQQGLVNYIDNLRKRKEASALRYEGPVEAAVSQKGSGQSNHKSPTLQDESRAGLQDDHSDQGQQLRDMSIDFGNSNIDKPKSCRVESIIQDTNQFILLSQKERKAYRKQKESLSKEGLGRAAASKTSETTATERTRPSRRTRRTLREANILSKEAAIDSKTEGIDLTELRRRKAADECLHCAWPFDRKGNHLVKDCRRPIKLDKGTTPFAKSKQYQKPVIFSEERSLEDSTGYRVSETTENSGSPK